MGHKEMGHDNAKQTYVTQDGNFVMTHFRRGRWQGLLNV